MGLPPRSLTAEANGCFMVRVPHGPNRIQGCGASIAPERGLPSDQLYRTSNNEGHRVAVTLDTKVLIQVLEMSQSSWLAAGVVPGIERRPLKKLDPDPTVLLRLVEGWRDHAMKVGRMITRIVLAFEAGRDGFWLARWLRARSIEPFVIHSTSIAVSREHRRAKTDRLDTEMLIRVFLGWLRGEPRHCK